MCISPMQSSERTPTRTSSPAGCGQRVMIEMAVSCNTGLLIADEPTTALDVTIQAQLLDLMRELQDRLGTAIIRITHERWSTKMPSA